MSDTVIKVENLTKEYRLGVINHGTLRQDFQSWWARVSGKEDPNSLISIGSCTATSNAKSHLLALNDVSFDVKQGEILGLIGRNGAGKSTLLKILSRVTSPTKGTVKIKGRVASLLEVGTGFHPELTGRENVYLNGSIMGMSKEEIKNRFDEIVAFAEIDDFIDTPVKRYSSGMYVRLAFAVAAHLEPEILVVDEVLAVGDASFQKKCLGKLGDVAKGGRTVLFVSHNMSSIIRLCSRAILLENGMLKEMGDTENIVERYLIAGSDASSKVVWPDGYSEVGINQFKLKSATIFNYAGEISSSLDIRMPIRIDIEYEICRQLSNVRIALRFDTSDGIIVFSTYNTDTVGEQKLSPGKYIARCELPGNFFNGKKYLLTIYVEENTDECLAHVVNVLAFDVENTGSIGSEYRANRYGVVRPKMKWEQISI